MLYKILYIFLGSIYLNCYALKVEINKGVVSPDPIAIVDFFTETGESSDEGTEISNIIISDLSLSGLFSPIDKNAFIEDKETLSKTKPNLQNWSILKARFLVYGTIANESRSKLNISFNLIDVITGQTMLSVSVSGNKSNTREIAHKIADYIYERVHNEQGYFDTKIAYVETADNKNPEKRKTKIVLIDQDGFNPRDLTNGKCLDIMPKFSNSNNKIAIISCSDDKRSPLGQSAHVYLVDIRSGSKTLLISEQIMKSLIKKNNGKPIQMTYAPHFSPDGTEVVLAIIFDGKSAIYKMNLLSNSLTQLTEHVGIDTSPCFSNDGTKIVFTSNREGTEAIYVMNSDGSDVKRISKEGGKYSQPRWSPRGDLIAFAKQTAGQFFIGVMKTDGSSERLISNGYLVECPDWSSNGRYIVYSAQPDKKSKSVIAITDLTGNYSRIIKTSKDASYPAWSPSEKVLNK
ncbi:MAG: Tol-Pal system protein TolB [Alphaproteobacteria bacterium]|nr:Tol-Pal system protein TolB [Alphaproteobacteria bacterium]